MNRAWVIRVAVAAAVVIGLIQSSRCDDHTRHSHQTKSSQQQAPTVATTVPDQESSSPTAADHHEKDARGDEQHPLWIHTPAKTWRDSLAYWANIALAAVGIFGVIAAIVTLRLIRKQANEMRLQRQTMEDTLTAIKTQTEISRKALISQFRPRVVVRTIWLNQKDGGLELELWLANLGQSPGHIQQGNLNVLWEVPGGVKKVIAHEDIQPDTLQPGEDHQIMVDLSDYGSLFAEAVRLVNGNRLQMVGVHCYGYLVYLDDNGARRSTGFCRKYSIRRERFLRSKDKENEYCD